MDTKTKSGTITVSKVDGTITDVTSDFHIDELFKIIHFKRSKLDVPDPDKDVLTAMSKMGWPIPQKSN